MSPSSPILRVLVDAPELLSDVLAMVRGDHVDVAAELVPDALAAASLADPGLPLLVASTRAPTLDQVLALAGRAGRARAIALAIPDLRSRAARLAPQLGLSVFDAIGPALAATRLVALLADDAPHVSSRGLGLGDRARLAGLDEGKRLVRLDDGWLGLVGERGTSGLGRVDDVQRAVRGLRETFVGERPSLPRVEGADRAAALEVLVGPARTLSDPASKAALEHYDLPLPDEEVCATASRAAAESQRIGYPVRVVLASPELRASEHPDLVVEGVEGSARVRETFRELVALAERKDPKARILGVTVGASTLASCLLHVVVERIAQDRLVATLGFADPHGRATDDAIELVLPASPADVADALRSLRGSALLRDAGPDVRVVENGITDVVLRLAAFLDDFPEEIETVRLDPIAVLTGGEVEIREARVRISDAFTRRLG